MDNPYRLRFFYKYVVSIKKSNIVEIISKDDGEYWYKAKINMVVSTLLGKEKKVNNYILVMGNDLKDAQKQLEDGLSYVLVPYVSSSIAISPICDVFPFVETKQ